MFVKSVEFDNLRLFDGLRFSFERPDGGFAGWTVFVGGNASGKSTLLKGIALALMGPKAGAQFLGDKAGWIRQDQKRAEAIVEVVTDKTHDKFRKRGRTAATFKAIAE